MKPSHKEPLTLVEAEREFGKVLRAFDAYVAKTEHLGQNAVLVAQIGDHAIARSQDPEVPSVPLLYGVGMAVARTSSMYVRYCLGR